MSKFSWITLVIITALVALSGIGILFAGVDAADFEASTGMAWTDFDAAQPAAASYIQRLVLLVGVASGGFGLLGLFISLTAFKNGQAWSRYAMALIPLVLAAYTVVFLLDGAQALGMYYAVLSIVSLVALLAGLRGGMGNR